MTRHAAKSIIAALILAVGVTVLVRALWRHRPPEVAPRNGGTPEPPARSDAEDAVPWDRPLEVSVAPGRVGRIAAAVSARARTDLLSGQTPLPLSSRRLEALEGDVASHVEAILSGSPERFYEYVRTHGGVAHELEEDDPARAERAQRFVASMLDAFHAQPLSLAGTRARAVVAGGEQVRHPSFAGRRKFVFDERRFPALKGLAKRTERGHVVEADTIEVLIPTRQRYEGDTKPVIIGIWYSWVPDENRWMPSRIYAYGDDDRRPLLTPPL